MVFSSNVFLFLFLPVFLGLYYLSGERYRNLLLLIASYVFYAWWRVDFLLLFAGVTVFNYWIGLRIGAAGVRTRAAQRWLILGVVVDLCVLGYFKYANFGVDSLNEIITSFGMQPFVLTHILLPIGISFYTFESISYIIDVYRGDTPATHNLIDFAAFVAIFPHLIAGPVLRFKDLVDQFNHRTHTVDKFAEGCTRFMQGFVKKVFIADTLAALADHCFALQNPTTGDAWLGALAYTAQLYFDFSGYSDMAIGLGLMMGFRFMENFNQPYISQSITEFWRRWHISLSTWLRDYLYISLGGNRGSTFQTYRNLFLTMLLGGLWHGANFTYIIWGAWHGMWLAIERALGVNAAPRVLNPLKWAFTFLLVVIGWVIFRAENLQVAWRMYEAMFSFGTWQLSELNRASLTGLQVGTLVLAYLVLAFFGLRQFYNQPLQTNRSVGLAEDLLGDLPAQRLQQGQFVGAGQAASGHLRVVEIAAQALVATAEELPVGPFEVEQQAQRLAYPAVLEQRPAQVEHQALEAGRVRVGKALLAQPAIAQGRRVVAAAPGLDAGLDIDVGLPGLERLQGHAAVAVVVETDPLEVVQATPDRQVASPPVGVAPVAHRTPRLGLLQPVRSAAQRRLHAAAVEVASLPPMPGQHVELGQHQRQLAVAGMTEIEADAQAILHHRLADLLVVGAPERAALLDQAIEGKLHVLGGDRHAVAEARPRIDMETHPAVVRGFLDVARQVAVFGERLVQ